MDERKRLINGFTRSIAGLFKRMEAHDYVISTTDHKGDVVNFSKSDVEEITLKKIWLRPLCEPRLLDKPTAKQVRFIKNKAEVYLFDWSSAAHLDELDPKYVIEFDHRIDGE